jgi:hypothetical protein
MIDRMKRRGNARRADARPRCPRCAPAAERLRAVARRQLFVRLAEVRGSICVGRGLAADLSLSLAELRQAAAELEALGAARLWVAGGGVLLVAPACRWK